MQKSTLKKEIVIIMILLDIKGNLNKRPLTYGNFHEPLTSNLMILERDIVLIPVNDLTSEDWRK